jgi:hypothetical protein
MSKCSIRSAAAWFLLSGSPLLPARFERPSVSPGVAVPAPEAPLPARAIGEHDLRLGGLRLQLVPAPTSTAPGEWNDEPQPDLFRVYVSHAPSS